LLAKGMSARIGPLTFSTPENAVLVPVSMHPRRQRERGYNQSALLARELSKLWTIALEVDALRRVRDTPQQALLSAEERRHNVKDAFVVKQAGVFMGKTILLIDDVVTTGSTINACAEALKSAGASRVCVLAAARA
jgi:ComF family protein